jgi:hypothetical protein
VPHAHQDHYQQQMMWQLGLLLLMWSLAKVCYQLLLLHMVAPLRA